MTITTQSSLPDVVYIRTFNIRIFILILSSGNWETSSFLPWNSVTFIIKSRAFERNVQIMLYKEGVSNISCFSSSRGGNERFLELLFYLLRVLVKSKFKRWTCKQNLAEFTSWFIINSLEIKLMELTVVPKIQKEIKKKGRQNHNIVGTVLWTAWNLFFVLIPD